MVVFRIREEFKFSAGVEKLANAFIGQAREGDNPLCSVHFRRGDYQQKSEYHTNLDGKYYNPALEMVQQQIPNTKFIAFTDDLEWARRALPPEFIINFPWLGSVVFFSGFSKNEFVSSIKDEAITVYRFVFRKQFY